MESSSAPAGVPKGVPEVRVLDRIDTASMDNTRQLAAPGEGGLELGSRRRDGRRKGGDLKDASKEDAALPPPRQPARWSRCRPRAARGNDRFTRPRRLQFRLTVPKLRRLVAEPGPMSCNSKIISFAVGLALASELAGCSGRKPAPEAAPAPNADQLLATGRRLARQGNSLRAEQYLLA